MALIKGEKVYRNLQEQVYENTCDIQELLRMYGYHGPYTSTDVIPNDDLYNRAMYLIGTGMPYKVYQYNDLTKRFTYIGDYNMDVGPEGPPGPQGPQGERGPDGKPASEIVNIETYDVIYKEDVTESKVRANFDDGHSNEFSVYAKNGESGPEGPAGPQGPQGEPGPAGKDGIASITVNGNTYEPVEGNITIPDYPTSLEWDNIENKPTNFVTTDTRQFISKEKIFAINEFDPYETLISDTDIIVRYKNGKMGTHISYDGIELWRPDDTGKETNCEYTADHLNCWPKKDTDDYKIMVTKSNDSSVVYNYSFVQGKSGEVAVTSEIPDVSNFITNTDLETTLGDYELKSDAFSGDYNDLTNKPTIPTKTSELTNDSGFIDSSALTGLATETYANNAANNAVNSLDQTLAQVAKTGSYSDISNKPDLTVYELKSEAFNGNYNDLTNKPDLSVYELKSEAFSGDYNDLTNKPVIPVVNYPVTSVNSKTGDVVLAAADINAKDNNTIQANIDRIDSDIFNANTNIANISNDIAIIDDSISSITTNIGNINSELVRIENKIPTMYLRTADVTADNKLIIYDSAGNKIEYASSGSSDLSPYVQCEYKNSQLIFTYNNGEGNKYNAISNKITINGTNYNWSGLSTTIDVDTTARGWNVKVVSTLTPTSGTIYSAYIVNPAFVDDFATVDQIPDISNLVTLDTEQTITANKSIKGTFSISRADNSTAFRLYNDQADQISFAGWKIVNGENVRTWYNLPLYDTKTSKTIATTDDIPTDYVSLTGDQTIGGKKTFTGGITAPNLTAQGASESTIYGGKQFVHTFKNNTKLNLQFPVKSGNKTIATTDDIYYQNNEKFVNNGYYSANGYLTGAGKQMMITIPLPKNLKNIKSVTVNKFAPVIRGIGGYVNGSQYIDYITTAGYTINPIIAAPNAISFQIIKETEFGGSNNTPVSLVFNTGNIDITLKS